MTGWGARAGRRWARSYPVSTFYVLAFGISWMGYLPGFARAWGVPGFASRLWLGALALPAVGPAVAAGVTEWFLGEGDGGWTRLWGAWTRRVGWGWWGLALLLPAAEMAGANGVSCWLWPGGAWEEAGLSAAGVGLAAGLSLGANPWEEVGWRGFALRRLEERHRGLVAALMVGVLWAGWHVPLFLLPGGPMSMAAMSFWVWAVGCVGKSVVLAWLYNRTSQSLGVVTVAHLASNIFGAMLGVRSLAMLSGVEVLVAVAVVGFAGVGLGRADRMDG